MKMTLMDKRLLIGAYSLLILVCLNMPSAFILQATHYLQLHHREVTMSLFVPSSFQKESCSFDARSLGSQNLGVLNETPSVSR